MAPLERILKGWLQPTLATATDDGHIFALGDLYETSDALQIPLTNSASGSTLYVSNRQRASWFDQLKTQPDQPPPFDDVASGLLTTGLLVQFSRDGEKLLDTLPSDNTLEREDYFLGTPNPFDGDLYGPNGSNQLTPWTRPNSSGCNGYSQDPLCDDPAFIPSWQAIDSIRVNALGEAEFVYYHDFRLAAEVVIRDDSWMSSETNNYVFSSPVRVTDGAVLRVETGTTVEFVGGLIVEDGGEFVCDPGADCVLDGDVQVTDDGSCILIEMDASVHFKGGVTATSGGFVANRGGTISIGDGAALTMTATAGPPQIAPGSAFALGQGAEVVLDRPVSIAGTAEAPVRFVRADPAKKWNDVEIAADSTTLEHVILDGGHWNLKLRGKHATLRHVTSRNGHRNLSTNFAASGGRSAATVESSTFENAATTGVVAYRANIDFADTVIRGSGETGLWISQADVTLDGTDVVHNGDPGTATASNDGIAVHDGGWLSAGANSQSRIEGNGRHEVSTSGNGWADLGSGYNSVCDAADPGTTGKYAHEGGSGVIYASKTWWGTTSPSASLFSGTVYYWSDHLYQAYTHDSYSEPCHSSAGAGTSAKMAAPLAGTHAPGARRASGAATSKSGSPEAARSGEADLVAALREARAALDLEAGSPTGAALAAEAYGALRRLEARYPSAADAERPATLALFERLRTGSGPASERAALVLVDVALRGEDVARARTLLDGLSPEAPQAQAEAAAATVEVLRREGHHAEALTVLGDAAGLLGEGYVAVVAADIEAEVAGATRASGASDLAKTAGEDGSALYTTGLAVPYPNPARGAVTVPMTLAGDAEVTVVVYDALGREVARLADGARRAGRHPLRLDTRRLAAGAYVVRATVATEGAAPEVFTRRLTVVR